MNNTIILERLRSIDISNYVYNFIKRTFDIILSLIGCLFIIIFMIIVKICYVLGGDFSPIIFKHTRIGKTGKTFKMYKFRTMVPNAQELLTEILKKNPKMAKEWKENHKLDKDPRITKIGGILRKTSIDELPQMINVLKGDMSLIGPRPLIDEEVEDYQENKEKLLSVKPGITGYWACNGRSSCTPLRRRNLELYYVDHKSILLDIKIFFMTIIKVIKKDGAK